VKVPLVDLGWQHALIKDEVAAVWQAIVDETAFIQGASVSAFESEFASYLGRLHCIGVANGTDALEICLRAVGVGPGDAVALPANTFIATAFAVARIGAVPRLFDVDEESLLLDPELLDVSGCRAVIPVHLFGQIAPMAALASAAGGVPIVEDAAQAQGATQDGRSIGSWGVAAATSFYPGKNLGAYGDAGAVCTDDGDVAATMRLMANHGSSAKYVHETLGFNSRLDTLQAAVLAAKLRHLDEWNTLRRQAAERYDVLLAESEQVTRLKTLPGNEHVWHIYPVRVPDRDAVLARLLDSGVGAAIHYATPVHLQPAFARLGLGRGAFPVAERAADTMISLPMFPGITAEQQEFVVDSLLVALR
jgi:dTDP-4-amino-4,6-dideoxygalactose transaminase